MELTESLLRSGGISLVWLVTCVVAVSSGAKALGTLLHEASVIATKARAEMKMIEFFIAKTIVVDGAGHSITKSLVVKRAGFVHGIRGARGHPAINSHSSAILRSGRSLRQRHSAIIKGKHRSCLPQYGHRDLHSVPRRLRRRLGFEHRFPLIRSLRASTQRSTSVLFSFLCYP